MRNSPPSAQEELQGRGKNGLVWGQPIASAITDSAHRRGEKPEESGRRDRGITLMQVVDNVAREREQGECSGSPQAIARWNGKEVLLDSTHHLSRIHCHKLR